MKRAEKDFIKKPHDQKGFVLDVKRLNAFVVVELS